MLASTEICKKGWRMRHWVYVIPTRNLGGSTYIISAVRTPVGKFQGQLSRFSATQLGTMAVEAAAKQAAVHYELIAQLYMGNVFGANLGQAPARQAAYHAGLKKSTCCTTISQRSHSGMKALISAAQSIELEQADAAIGGGMEALSNVPYYLRRGQTIYGGIDLEDGLAEIQAIERKNGNNYNLKGESSAQRANYALDTGVLEVRIQERGKPLVVIENDETKVVFPEADFIGDGAAAVLLANEKTAKQLNLHPLARVVGYKITGAGSMDEIIGSMMSTANVNIEKLQIFELAVPKFKPLALPDNLRCKMNRLDFEKPIGFIGPYLVTNLCQKLMPGYVGCAAVAGDGEVTSAILIEKLAACHENDVPILTLYTKDPCPLCDMLVEELESNYAGEYQLEKVFIDVKENVRFLRLYRSDIPVLFFNGQFLCMHRLNRRSLESKLREFKENKEF